MIDVKKTARERFEAILVKHTTGRDGVWVQCDCHGGWMGLAQWAGHVAGYLVAEITVMADELADEIRRGERQ